MSSLSFIMAIDQGTSGTKTLLFNNKGEAVARGSVPLHTNYTEGGFAEQDPEEIYTNTLQSVKACLADFESKGGNVNEIVSCGISNQRETFVVWDEAGQPLYPAVVWQCRRSVSICEQLKEEGYEPFLRSRTGLLADPYFSATKLVWMVQNLPHVAQAIKIGQAFFGTVDTWLLYKLTDGKQYATDYTNASRTLLFNLNTLEWDEQIISLLGLTGIQLPTVKASAADFGNTRFDGMLPNDIQIAAMIGDSHAAAFGEGCVEKGSTKATLGTGCSLLMNVGGKPVHSDKGMVSTICWSMQGQIHYALEGVIVSCGATIEWLKKEWGIFESSAQTEAMALAVSDNNGVVLIPAFSGLGAPHWQPQARAIIAGLSFNANRNHLVRAALESIPFQIKDVVDAMEKDAGIRLQQLHANGGITANSFVMQMLADVLNKPISLQGMPDVSALGAALLAGLQTGVFTDLEQVASLLITKRSYKPGNDQKKVKTGYAAWKEAIKIHYPG